MAVEIDAKTKAKLESLGPQIEARNPFTLDVAPHESLRTLGRGLPYGTVLVFERSGESDNAVYLVDTLNYPVIKADPDIIERASFVRSARMRSVPVRGIDRNINNFDLSPQAIAAINPEGRHNVQNVFITDPNLGLMDFETAKLQLESLQNLTASMGMHILEVPANPQGLGLVFSRDGHGENERLRKIYLDHGFEEHFYTEISDGPIQGSVSSIFAVFRKR